jgi:ABC-type multidrug transport system ATPase subunit
VTASALSFSGLHRRFGALRVLVDAAGEVEAGGVLRILGPNGSGKSTLLRCLAGLLRPDRGEIRARERGRELDDRGAPARVGYVAPDLAFYDELTGPRTWRSSPACAASPGARRGAARAARARRRAPLPRLSSGMRQRLRWAFALLTEPACCCSTSPSRTSTPRARPRPARCSTNGSPPALELAVVASPGAVDLPGDR